MFAAIMTSIRMNMDIPRTTKAASSSMATKVKLTRFIKMFPMKVSPKSKAPIPRNDPKLSKNICHVVLKVSLNDMICGSIRP